MKAEDAICLYLIEMSEFINSKIFKVMTMFFEHYLICANIYGWDLVNNYQRIKIDEYEKRKQFCSAKPPEYLPLISNIFIQRYLTNHLKKFDRSLAIRLIKHF